MTPATSDQRYLVSATGFLRATPAEVWEVISDTSRYADWVVGCLEVTAHHGTATEGLIYTERNRTLGPFTARSHWTVLSQTAPRERVDRGTGLAPLRNLINIFELTPKRGGQATEMLYQVRFDLPFGSFAAPLAAALGATLRREFCESMRRLDALIRSERPAGKR